jgi:hypothetical protein
MIFLSPGNVLIDAPFTYDAIGTAGADHLSVLAARTPSPLTVQE